MIVFLRWYGRILWLRRETPGCICTGVAFEATTEDPNWWQIAIVPVKIGGAIMPFADKLNFFIKNLWKILAAIASVASGERVNLPSALNCEELERLSFK